MAEGSGYDAGRIEAALDVDRTPFQQGLEAAKREARDFADGKYEASLGAETRSGEASLAAFKHRLDEIAREHPTVKVDADTGKADAALAATDAEIRKVKRDAKDAGDNGLKSLWTWGAALGPALVPVLATAAAGAAGLGTAFAAAGAGALGFGVVAKGAFSDIEKQQKAMLAAEKQYTAATTDKARAAALLKEKAAWDALTPSEQAASKALETLESRFHAAEKALQPIVLTALTPWLNTATTAVGFLTPMVTSASGAIGTLGREAQTALGSPYWQQFSDFLAREAQPALFSFGQTVGNVAHGFAGLMMAFDPMVHDVESGMIRLSQRFAHWGAGLSGSGSFQGFMTYVEQVGPQVMHTIGDVASALGHVLAAAAPLGPPLLQIVDLVARLVAWQPEIVAFGIAIYGWTRIFSNTAGAVAGLTEKLVAFRGASIASAAVTAESGAAATSASAGFGLLGAALAVLVVPLALSYSSWQKNTAAVKDAHAAATTGVQTFQSMNDTLAAQVDKLDKAHHWWSGYTDIFQSNTTAANKLTDAQQRLGANVDQVSNTLHMSRDAVVELAQAAGVDLTANIGNATTALAPFITANYAALTSNNGLTDSMLQVDATFRAVASKNNTGIGAYGQALTAVFGLSQQAFTSTIQYKSSLADLNTQLSKNKHTLDINTAAGRENVNLVSQAVQLAEQQAGAVADQAYQTSHATTQSGRNNDAVKAGNGALATNIKRLEGQMRQAGYSQGQIDNLLQRMHVLSKTNAVGKVGLAGYNTANAQLNTLLNKLDYLNSRQWYATIVENVVPPGTIPKSYQPYPVTTPGGPPGFQGLLDPGVPAPNLQDTSPRSGGPRASGGPTIAGTTYLIGEHGPEYWTAAANGYVTPNEAVPVSLGGQARGGDSAELLAAMSNTNALLAQQNAILRATLSALYAVPAGTADALNGVSHAGAHQARGIVPVY